MLYSTECITYTYIAVKVLAAFDILCMPNQAHPSPSTWMLPPSITMGHSKRLHFSICSVWYKQRRAKSLQAHKFPATISIAAVYAYAHISDNIAYVGAIVTPQATLGCRAAGLNTAVQSMLACRMQPATCWSFSQDG